MVSGGNGDNIRALAVSVQQFQLEFGQVVFRPEAVQIQIGGKDVFPPVEVSETCGADIISVHRDNFSVAGVDFLSNHELQFVLVANRQQSRVIPAIRSGDFVVIVGGFLCLAVVCCAIVAVRTARIRQQDFSVAVHDLHQSGSRQSGCPGVNHGNFAQGNARQALEIVIGLRNGAVREKLRFRHISRQFRGQFKRFLFVGFA